jgi:hypothetical protein
MPKNRPFFEIFAQNLRISANFLPLYARFCTTSAPNLRK